jgi:hypothetical protein
MALASGNVNQTRLLLSTATSNGAAGRGYRLKISPSALARAGNPAPTSPHNKIQTAIRLLMPVLQAEKHRNAPTIITPLH